jgi:hypothetical protein
MVRVYPSARRRNFALLSVFPGNGVARPVHHRRDRAGSRFRCVTLVDGGKIDGSEDVDANGCCWSAFSRAPVVRDAWTASVAALTKLAVFTISGGWV